MMFFMYLLGAFSIMIQLISAKKAVASRNYWEIKKTAYDLICDFFVFIIAMNGGVGGFYIAILASFMMTCYLNWFGPSSEDKPQPYWWCILTGQKYKKV